MKWCWDDLDLALASAAEHIPPTMQGHHHLRLVFSNKSSASFSPPFFLHVNARLPMLVSVSGCSAPSTLFLVSITCTNSSSASFHRPWFLNVDARLAMLVSVEGCSAPNALFLV